VLLLDSLLTRADVSEELKQQNAAIDGRYASLGLDVVIPDAFSSTSAQIMSGEDCEVLQQFLKTAIDPSKPYCSLGSEQLNGDKENRKAFHALVREHYGDILVTDTLEEGISRSILVWIKKFHEEEQRKFKADFKANQRGGKRPRGTREQSSNVSVGVMMKDPWPKDRPDHLHFRLYKENRDTAEAIQSLSRCLSLPPKSFSFCGTKDRRGITVQSVSVYRVSIESMKRALLHPAWDNAVRVSHMEYKSYPNKIGRSGGNHFKICLRRISSEFPDNQIDSLFSQLGEKGFLNYYGLQRFGTRSVRTHEIGSLLLAQNWKGAVDALLSPEADNLLSNGGSRKSAEWRESYAKGDIEEALNLCPAYMYIERSLLRALHKSGQSANYLNAIQSLPTSNFQLYLHAVQSIAFNAVLSERIRKFGLEVQIGDLVQIESNDEHASVKVIESIQEARQYSINDVVLTLPGNSVQIPPIMANFYSQYFAETLKVNLADITAYSKRTPALIQLKGAYREMVKQAKALKWEIMHNVTDNDILIKSDVEVLQGNADSRTPSASTGSYKAVVFECNLDSGVYLTMALREVSETREAQPERPAKTSEVEDEEPGEPVDDNIDS